MQERILITGAAGFIGSHLCKRLLNEGHEVWGLDNLYTGSADNVTEIAVHPNFKTINRNLIYSKPEGLVDLEFTQIYNLACPASPIHYQKNPVFTIRTCVEGMINMLELTRQLNCRLLQASTSEVYGDPDIHPQPEEYWGNVNSFGARSCYDEGKRCAEALCYSYIKQDGLNVKIARIFNTYGPNMAMNDGRVISNFIVQSLQGKNITVYGNGEQTRSFCYVDDTVEALIRLMNCDKNLGPVNIGNPEERTILEIARFLLKKLPKVKVEFVELPEDDPIRRQPNIDKAILSLKWTPKVSFEEGMNRTIVYFKKVLRERI